MSEKQFREIMDAMGVFLMVQVAILGMLFCIAILIAVDG